MISSLRGKKELIRTYGYWVFAGGMGIILIFLDAIEDVEPFFSILAFFYWALLFYWGARWIFGQIRSTIKQRQDKKSIELLHLQSQVSPHFFFNMLNNLYGLVTKDQKRAQDLILKLSDMMRYSIYEGQKEVVTLAEEVLYLKNYIQLHSMRYHKKVQVNFETDIANDQQTITPLLFIMLLENAFKHGVENLTHDAFITINLTSNKNKISFEVENNYDATLIDEHKGIGLINLKRRLALAYPKNHTLNVSKDDRIYKAKLILQV